jgi:ABC-type transporter Mla subunit MlaD
MDLEIDGLISTFVDLAGIIGVYSKNIIIGVAEVLTKSESSPGIIALLFLAILVFASVSYFIKTSGQKRAIRQMDSILSKYEGIPELAENFSDFRKQIADKKGSSKSWGVLWESWDEFCETIVLDDIDGPMKLRNSIRPSSFMNVEDLGFAPGFYRILPNIFVSLGLFLTFLGLVAALHEFALSMEGTSEGANMDSAMTGFMTIASAKFTMSLVGLLCSIIFTMLLRARTGTIDRVLHKLCMKIERRLVFVSLEDLGFRQLRAATEQREHLREIGFGMVAELRKPLDALPDQISSAIAASMDPIFEKVTAMGTSNMEGMVGDLSSQLSQSVGNALNRASESLGEASDRIGVMVDRMNTSNAQAGDGLQTALGQMATALTEMRSEIASSGQSASTTMNEGADRLLSVMNETLSGIRDNTSQGAEAMSIAADDMRKAAEGFRETLSSATADGMTAVEARMAASSAQAGEAIEGAGKNLMQSFDATSKEIARLGAEMGGAIGDELLSKLMMVGTQLEGMAEAIQKGTIGAQNAATGMNKGAQAIVGASESFNSASRDLVSASEPIRASHERIEGSLNKLGTTVDSVSETLMRSSKMIAENASHVLETAQAALGNEREGIRNSLEATRAVMAQLANEAEKLDQIDEMLGRALQQYNSQLDAAMGSAQDHISQMRDTLAPGIDTLKSVVEQAESFMPAQTRKS